MESVVLIILALAYLGFVLKLGFRSPWWWLGWAVATAVATGMAWPLAAGQSKTQIADFLQSPSMMADAAVLITLEVALMLAWCILRQPEPTRKRPWLRRLGWALLDFFPGVLAFVALFSLQTTLVFSFTGVSFALISWTMAAAVGVLTPALAWLLRRLLPEEALRQELLFVVYLIIGGLGIVATVNGRTAVVGTATAEWPQLLTVAALCAAGVAAGVLLRRRKTKNRKP